MEELGLVERLAFDRQRKIEPDRADGRLPRDPETGGDADRGRVADVRLEAAGDGKLRRRQHDVLLVVGPEAAEIAEHAPGYAELLWQAKRDAESDRSGVVFVAAKPVAA